MSDEVSKKEISIEHDAIIDSKPIVGVNLDECYVKLDDISLIDPAVIIPYKISNVTVDDNVDHLEQVSDSFVLSTGVMLEDNAPKCLAIQNDLFSFTNNSNTFLNDNSGMYYACISTPATMTQPDQILQLIPQNQLSNYIITDKEYSAVQFMNAPTLLSGNQFFNNDLSDVALKSSITPNKQSCNICIVNFQSKRAYLKHMTIHENDREFKCRWCKVSYNHEINLLVHVAIIHPNQCSIGNGDDMNYRCLVCALKFTRKKALQGHCLIHQVDEELLCDRCSASFNSRVLLEMHMTDHDPDTDKPVSSVNVLHCKLCEETFNNVALIRRHHKQCHPKEERASDEEKKQEMDDNQNFDPSNKRRSSQVALQSFKLLAQEKTKVASETRENRKRGRPRKLYSVSKDGSQIDICCDVCHRKFKTPILLRRHKVTHTGVKEFECPICNKLFTQKSSVKIHMAVHESEKAFQCEFCHKSFTYEHNMQTHVRTVHRSETRKQWQQIAEDNNNDVTMAEDGAMKSNFLPYRRVQFISSTPTTQRTESVHEPEMKKPRRCKFCKSRRRRSCQLCRHVNLSTQQKPFKCNFCYKMFQFGSVLDKHINTHTKLTQYQCELCSIIFSTQQILNIHLKWHNGQPMKYRCYNCTKKFINITNYHRHYETQHAVNPNVDEIVYLDSGPPMTQLEGYVLQERSEPRPYRPFKCHQCNKSYKLRRYLRDHLKDHANSNHRQACSHCNKTFITIRSLQQHLRTQHINRRIFSCNLCSATFILKASLVRHGLVHTNLKPYACPICFRQFKAKIYCDRHINLQKCSKVTRRSSASNGIVKLGKNIESEIVSTEEQPTIPYCNYRLVDLETSEASTVLISNFVNEYSDKYMVVSLDKDGVPHPGQPAYFVDDRNTGENILTMLSTQDGVNPIEIGTVFNYGNNSEIVSYSASEEAHPLADHVYYYQPVTPVDKPPIKGSLADKFPILKATLFSDDEEAVTELDSKLVPETMVYCEEAVETDVNKSSGKSYHGCANCTEVFSNSTALISHVKHYHTIDKDFICSICHKAFSANLALWAHLKIHETDGNSADFLTCIACNQRFLSVPSLSRHVRMQHNDKLNLYRCTHCEMTYKTTRELDSHIKQLISDYDAIVINSQLINNPLKDEAYQKLSRDLRDGNTIVDFGESQIDQLASLDVDKTTKLSMQELIKAARERRGSYKSSRKIKSEQMECEEHKMYPFRCVVCYKGFNRSSNLQQHLSVHTKMTPYQCSKCNRKFRHRCSLKTHENTKHSFMTKLLRCHLCLKLLRSQVALRNHMKIHLKNYSFQCEKCHIHFSDYDEHEQHQNLNQCKEIQEIDNNVEVDIDEDRQELVPTTMVKCVTCSVVFHSFNDYGNHQCNKPKQKSHQCVLCNETFISSEELCSHICDVHKQQTKYNCSLCNILFVQESLLLCHQKSVHNI